MVIAMMMQAVKAYETPLNLYETKRRNIPEGNHLQPDKTFLFTNHMNFKYQQRDTLVMHCDYTPNNNLAKLLLSNYLTYVIQYSEIVLQVNISES
jgi:hypothetical protein